MGKSWRRRERRQLRGLAPRLWVGAGEMPGCVLPGPSLGTVGAAMSVIER